MNPARTFGPDLVGNDWTACWADVVGPLLGAVIAVAFAYVLRGPGGGMACSAAAQGGIFTEARRPGQG
jgi:aquaporin Z